MQTQWTTEQHLASWIANTVCEDHQGAFQDFALQALAQDQAYWEREGWRKLYTQFLDELPAYTIRKAGAK